MSTPTSDEPESGTPAAQPPPTEPGFAPVPRPPRVPWLNPARRTQFAGSAIVAAVLLIGAGFGIGYAVGGSKDDDGHGMMDRGRYMLPYDMRGELRLGPNGYPMPRLSKLPLISPSTVTVTVTPSPASSS
jgi:hypothetical protein